MSEIKIDDYNKIFQDLEIHKEELIVQNEELKEKEICLNQAYEDYFSLFHESPIAYLIVDKNLQVFKYNQKANETFLNMLDSPHYKFLIKYIDPKTMLNLKDWLLNNDENNDKEYFICDFKISKNKTKFKIYSSPFKSKKNSFLLTLVNIQDEYNMMEENKKLLVEKERQTQTILLQAKLATIGEMLGNIAHQWKQPLNTLSMLISSSKVYIKSLNKDKTTDLIEDSLEKSLAQIMYLSETVNNFNKFFISQNVIESYFDLQICLKNIETFTFTQFKDNFVKINSDLEKVTLYGNQNQLTQVILNLLSNAKDALIENNPDSHRFIFLKSYSDKENAYITIKDCAGGIDESIIDNIFDQFFTTKDAIKGTGLGLHLSKKIIEQQFKGTIEVKNVSFNYNEKRCKGAEFTITLPFRNRSEALFTTVN